MEGKGKEGDTSFMNQKPKSFTALARTYNFARILILIFKTCNNPKQAHPHKQKKYSWKEQEKIFERFLVTDTIVTWEVFSDGYNSNIPHKNFF